MNKVYKQKYPNRFLASLVPFLAENITDKYCSNLVENSFEEFLNRNILSYPNAKRLPISFVGSVAYFFKEQLQMVVTKNRLKLNIIVKDPLSGLLNYHLKK